jgi:methylated-DNA-[protein]-cysteine S-methyltransferase
MRVSQPSASSEFLLVDSPMGLLRLEASDKGLVAMDWVKAADAMISGGQGSGAARVLRQSARWLASYFKGHGPPSSLPPLALTGTEFQMAVWRWLADLPAAQLTTYGEIARALGNPGACRAVGQAVGANPVPIFIPCRRVLAANGKMGGYSSGLPRKRWLLVHEGLAGRLNAKP